jgi:hypothetical protein
MTDWAPVVETMRVAVVEWECDGCGARAWAKIPWSCYTADKTVSFIEDWFQGHERECRRP